jgi:hypothetical protein
MALVKSVQAKRDTHRVIASPKADAAEYLLVTARPYLGQEIKDKLK